MTPEISNCGSLRRPVLLTVACLVGFFALAAHRNNAAAQTSIDQLRALHSDAPLPESAWADISELLQQALEQDEWGTLVGQCEHYRPIFQDYSLYGAGTLMTDYLDYRGYFFGSCGEGAFRRFQKRGARADLVNATTSLRIAGESAPDPFRTYLLGMALDHLSRSGLRDEAASWELESEALWTMWQAIELHARELERPHVLNAVATPAVAMGLYLLRRIASSFESHGDKPERVIEMVPLVRIVADRFRYFNSGQNDTERVQRERAPGRSPAGSTLDSRFSYRLVLLEIGEQVEPEQVDYFSEYYASLGQVAKGLFWATYYNDENPVAGIHRWLGLQFRDLYYKEIDNGNLFVAEQLFDQSRSCFVTARKYVGRSLSPADAETVGTRHGKPGDANPANTLAEVELLLQQAELELWYGVSGEGFRGDRDRKISMAEAAFSNIRAAAELVQGFVPGLNEKLLELPHGCISGELDKTEILIMQVRSRYAELLGDLVATLTNSHLPRDQISRRIVALQANLDLPFYFKDKEDIYVLIGRETAAQGRQKDGLDLALRGFKLLLKRGRKPFATWLTADRAREMPEPTCLVWKMIVSGDESLGPPASGLLGGKCEVALNYLRLLQQYKQLDQLNSLLEAMRNPALQQKGQRYEHFNDVVCDLSEFPGHRPRANDEEDQEGNAGAVDSEEEGAE